MQDRHQKESMCQDDCFVAGQLNFTPPSQAAQQRTLPIPYKTHHQDVSLCSEDGGGVIHTSNGCLGASQPEALTNWLLWPVNPVGCEEIE